MKTYIHQERKTKRYLNVTFLRRDYTNKNEAHEKMVSTTNHYENANSTTVITPHPLG
jgi:hypothetical protein